MATATQPRVQSGVPTGGQFAAQQRSEADIALAATDTPICEIEARALFDYDFPGASQEDFDAALFDTWDSGTDYDRTAADVDSELVVLGDRLRVEDLPSGGVAAFWVAGRAATA